MICNKLILRILNDIEALVALFDDFADFAVEVAAFPEEGLHVGELFRGHGQQEAA